MFFLTLIFCLLCCKVFYRYGRERGWSDLRIAFSGAATGAALVLIALALAGCSPDNHDALSARQTENPNFQVALLFTQDGCKIYRFYDGYARYFVVCSNAHERVAFDDHHTVCTKSGKTTVCHDYAEPNEVETVER